MSRNTLPERGEIREKNTPYNEEKGADCRYREDLTPIDKIVLRFSNESGMIKALFANL